jgi:hypothetical protein
VETAALLRDPHSGVSVGLIQGGVIGAGNTAGLESLGTLAYEPLWWFHRRENQGAEADGLRGRKIAIGPQGSGTRALSLELIKRTGMERQIGELLAFGPREAAEKLNLSQRLRQFRLALHDENAVRNEAEILSHRLEVIFEFWRILRRKRLDPRRWARALIH